jgi:toxin ParE1/3/4
VAPERFYLHPSASRDLREATKRYRERDKDIAADFVKAVDDAIATIVAAPQRWPVKTRWRRHYLKRFPFTIAFREAGEVIEIGAVAHQKRRPDYWTRRR